MKTKLFVCAFICFFSFFCGRAQNHNGVLAVELGASVNYYYGLTDRNFGKFENDRVNWQLNGLLGLTLARDRADRRTMIAAFGGFGFNNNQTISALLQDQQYTTLAQNQASSNNFYQLEGGIVIADLIRISTGVGQQNFNSQILVSNNGISTNVSSLKYNSTTVGLKFVPCNFLALNLNCNFEYGQDFNKTIINPNLGLTFRL